MNAGFSRRLRRAPIMVALAFAIAVLFFEGGIHAQLSDKESLVTFKVPVEIPGSNPQVLPAGTYRFRIVDSKSEPHIVQISDKDNLHVYSTALAIPAHRDAATTETVMTFQERGSGRPDAIQMWFYPHDTNGEEFVYAKVPPVAQVASTPAPAPAPVVDTPPQPEVAVNTPPPAPEPPQRVEATPVPRPAPAAEPAPAPVQPAAEAAAPPAEPPKQPAALPKTASNLPLLALVGILSISFSFGLKWIRKS